ncbi:ORF25 protein [Operophtera brumata nucleopolyhedrovirus]|uniref:ORF25 protein n=1 Tax=Operophtera brumata nucleopolyhedrovirus TaxID=1046267 RepID=A0A2H4UZR1_9ABAC|nr:ORF25 protein [Operophtera brumata nucleopolyhedrovirus]AUA60256.1 ORF25 protein [Operophtera brumata nucleopolyhedrovirus]
MLLQYYFNNKLVTVLYDDLTEDFYFYHSQLESIMSSCASDVAFFLCKSQLFAKTIGVVYDGAIMYNMTGVVLYADLFEDDQQFGDYLRQVLLPQLKDFRTYRRLVLGTL